MDNFPVFMDRLKALRRRHWENECATRYEGARRYRIAVAESVGLRCANPTYEGFAPAAPIIFPLCLEPPFHDRNPVLSAAALNRHW